MRPCRYALILLCGSALALLTGCGGGGGCPQNQQCGAPVSFGNSSGSENFNLYTTLSTGYWHNAVVSGQVVGTGYLADCNPQTDPTCMLTFGKASDGNAAQAIIYTDAVSPSASTAWTFYGAPDTNCSTGAGGATQYVWASGSGSQAYLSCGQTDPIDGSVEPSECTVTYVNGQLYQGCPSTIEMIASGVTYPTTYPLEISYYDLYGNSLGSEQDTAASSTIINFDAPNNWGINAITVTDPTTNLVLSAAGYTLDECLVTIDPPNNSSTVCPY